MKILFINPPDDVNSLLGHGASLVTPLEPLGLLYIAASCRTFGHEVSFIDAHAEGLDENQLLLRIRENGPDVIGFTSFISNGGFLYTFGKRLKAELPNIVSIFGNVQAETYAHEFIQNGCCDIVVKGEGEYVIPNILKTLQNENFNALKNIPGLVIHIDGDVVNTGHPETIEDLSGLPIPARDLIIQDLYKKIAVSNFSLYKIPENKTIKHLFTSRGCVNRCDFCVVHKSRKIRLFPIETVLEEVDILLNKYNAGYIFFMDSLFTNNKKRVIQLCDALKTTFKDIKWGCEAHVNFIDSEIVKAMDASGCIDMNFGIESGVDRLLAAINKRQTTKQISNSIHMVKKVSDINCIGLFILGLPGETPADTQETIDFAASLPLDMAQFSILTPYPGSPIFERLRAAGEIDDGIRNDGTIDCSVWHRYSAYASFSDNKPIWVTKEQTPEQLLAFQKKALRQFYFRPRQVINQLRRMNLSDLPDIVRAAFKVFF